MYPSERYLLCEYFKSKLQLTITFSYNSTLLNSIYWELIYSDKLPKNREFHMVSPSSSTINCIMSSILAKFGRLFGSLFQHGSINLS